MERSNEKSSSKPERAFVPDLAWTDVAESFAQGAIGLLPIGATEAHGPHLPLQTDVYLSIELCERLRRALEPKPSIVLAPIPFAVTEFAAGFAGTISLSPATSRELFMDVLRSLGRHGLETVALVSNHLEPAHFAILAEVAAAFPEKPRAILVNHSRRPLAQRIPGEFQTGDAHAGCYETSLLLASRFASTVRMERMKTLPPQWLGLVKHIKSGVTTFEAMGAHDAYFGEPAASTAAEGERLWTVLVEIWMEALRA
ncbi:MAG: creatininase family protein [Planctomycetes bacterium]|nr:creatininase family protein [Planctomycetota bacterium]